MIQPDLTPWRPRQRPGAAARSAGCASQKAAGQRYLLRGSAPLGLLLGRRALFPLSSSIPILLVSSGRETLTSVGCDDRYRARAGYLWGTDKTDFLFGSPFPFYSCKVKIYEILPVDLYKSL